MTSSAQRNRCASAMVTSIEATGRPGRGRQWAGGKIEYVGRSNKPRHEWQWSTESKASRVVATPRTATIEQVDTSHVYKGR
jgi:hypothetical protein